MKKIYTLIPLIFLLINSTNSFAQKKVDNLFANNTPLNINLSKYLKKGETVNFNKTIATQILKNELKNFELSFQFENKEWIIALEENKILSDNFFVTIGTNPKDKLTTTQDIVHYKGKIKGKEKSFAAVSICEDKIIAVLADEAGNINIGAINTNEARNNNEHIIYREADLMLQNEFACNTPTGSNTEANPIPTYNTNSITATINPEPVDVYFEADYQTYLNNGNSVTNVVNYVTALFNVVKVIYENDSVNTNISAIKVWNIADPYVSLTTTSAVLNAFANNMTNGFPGDLSHFLSQRSLGGGIAYLNILCSGNYYKTAVSGNLSNSFGLFPTYSWSVMVISHEMGHNLGSPHTQSCSWPGGAIDNCYTVEGSCALGPAPTNGGTIMSYCHLTGYGINLANGFGLLPGAKIRSYVRNNTCINPSTYFETQLQSVTEETADVPNGCLNYKLVTAKLRLPYAATQPVNVTLVPTGTVGLDIGTNKDVEVSPLSFVLDANNLTQTINIKVYNDALIENLEKLTINYNINANGGNAIKKTTNINHVVNITSEDHKPDSTINQMLYYEPFDTITTGFGAWTQNIVYGNLSPNRWIIANDGSTDFPTKAAYISNNGGSLAYSGIAANDSAIVRLESPSINANGFTDLKISFLQKVLGESISGGIAGGSQGGASYTDYGRVLYSTNNGLIWNVVKDNILFYSTKYFLEFPVPADANNAPNLKIAFEWRNNNSVVNLPPFIVDSIVIKGASTCAIQTLADANNSIEEYVGPNQKIHFYNPITQNIIATIENISNFDFGCTKVELIRTGVNAAQAWSYVNADKISDKVFKITTTNTNSAAPYTLKLYYENAEINGWQTSTGNSLTDAKIVKTNSDITTLPILTSALISSINNTTIFGATPHKVIAASYSGIAPISFYAIVKPFGVGDCPATNINYSTNIAGSAFQWQVNSGSGYSNISNNATYNNSSTNNLDIIAPNTNLFGNKYRCIITSEFGTVYSQEFVLKFTMTWNGSVSNAWEEPLNWSCNVVPNDKTDVIINNGTPFSPQVNSSTSIRSVTTNVGVNLLVKSGVNFLINH